MAFKSAIVALVLTVMALSPTSAVWAAKNDKIGKLQTGQIKKENSRKNKTSSTKDRSNKKTVKKKKTNKKSTKKRTASKKKNVKSSKQKEASNKKTNKKTAKKKKTSKKNTVAKKISAKKSSKKIDKKKRVSKNKKSLRVVRHNLPTTKEYFYRRGFRRNKPAVVQKHIVRKQYRNKFYAERSRSALRYASPGIPLRIILERFHENAFRKLRVRDRHSLGYTIKACRRGNKVVFRVDEWGDIIWRKHAGDCFRSGHLLNLGGNIVLRFSF